MRRDSRYLEKKGMREVDGQIVQKSGDRNALGHIKLVFPNPHSVYLHDTPSKSYFNETTRTVHLKRPIPVLILYWTASVGRDGRTYFLPDVYGRDPAIIRGLKGESNLRKLARRASK